MLGNKIGSESGQVTGRRVLPGDEFRYMKLEVSFESSVELLGMQGQNIGTYTVVDRGPGQIYAEGQGIIMMGEAGIIWNGHGVVQVDAEGNMMIAASIAMQTTSEQLARLNQSLILVESHSHANGHLHSELSEWTVASH